MSVHDALTHPAQGFCQHLRRFLQILHRNRTQNGKLRTEIPQKLIVHALHLLCPGSDPQDLRQDFRQGDKRGVRRLVVRPLRRVTIGQGKDAVQNADSHGFAADRTDALVASCLPGFKHNPALAMSVQVIFPLFGVEFESPLETRSTRIPAQGTANARKGLFAGKDVRLSTELLPGVSIGVGNQGKPIQAAPQPVHLGIRGQARLQGENLVAQIAETVLDTVEPGLGSEQGEPRRPDMGWNNISQRVRFQNHLQQVARVQAQDGTAIRSEVAHLAKTGVEFLCRVQPRHEHQVVHFTDLPPPLVDGADLRTQEKTHILNSKVTGIPGQLRLDPFGIAQSEQAVFFGFELFAYHLHPAGMSEIARGQDVDSFDRGPGQEVSRSQILARGPGKTGMNMKVGNIGIHDAS